MDWLMADADEVAPRLLGMVLTTRVDGDVTSVAITEAEAYLPDDPACHTFRGRTPRNAPMFEAAGVVYVYRSYGIHWCVNLVTGPIGSGQAVLVRAGEPRHGYETMVARRGRADHLADGPGKLCQALAIDGGFSGTKLGDRLELTGTPGERSWSTTPRIGISVATEAPLRFVATGAAR
jgi:DNA-3-methyladenine glycosylase